MRSSLLLVSTLAALGACGSFGADEPRATSNDDAGSTSEVDGGSLDAGPDGRGVATEACAKSTTRFVESFATDALDNTWALETGDSTSVLDLRTNFLPPDPAGYFAHFYATKNVQQNNGIIIRHPVTSGSPQWAQLDYDFATKTLEADAEYGCRLELTSSSNYIWFYVGPSDVSKGFGAGFDWKGHASQDSTRPIGTMNTTAWHHLTTRVALSSGKVDVDYFLDGALGQSMSTSDVLDFTIENVQVSCGSHWIDPKPAGNRVNDVAVDNIVVEVCPR